MTFLMAPLVFLGALPLLVDPTAPEVDYRGLSPGDRIELGFHGGGGIQGQLLAPPSHESPQGKMKRVDFTQGRSLTLDLSLEYPGLNGTVTVAKREIQYLKKLEPFDREERARRWKKKEALAEVRKMEEEGLAQEPSRKAERSLVKRASAAPPTGAPNLDQVLALKRGLELYLKFPPCDWGPDREQEIRLKQFHGQMPTLPEREFHDGFALWVKARLALDQLGGALKK